MFLKLDGELLPYPPDTCDIIVPGFEEHPLSGGNTVLVEDRQGVTVNANWEDVNTAAIVEWLMWKRGNWPIHMLEVDDVKRGKAVAIPVYMPRLSLNRMLVTIDCEYTNAAFSVAFKQVIPDLQPVYFELRHTGTVSTGDDKDRWKAPFAGKVCSVTGSIVSLGTGTGQTRIQIRRDSADDLLSTRGDFVVGGVKRLVNQVIDESQKRFIAGTVFHLDVDTIPSNANSSGVLIRVGVYLHRT